ncbi:MAG: beta-N-acetylhexosaminidase [Chromatiaceae bacterium]|nr:beta-N-acetylhexosaminidase [Gammaproteobacteria bacterium]MCP5306487.1 beta-N-acetylhexosaminidase [Chromatiaceae bacterium]MCP5312039.1 beta-N-acetylhexosaminidase [Chromatiaceae bacterium]
MLHGPVMIDLRGPELCVEDRELLLHPATGGVILFARNYVSPRQIYRLVREIHELRSPHLLIAVDQEGGRVQRFRDGFTRLPPAAKIVAGCDEDLRSARRAARELGWLMAAELRAVGVDFSFAPVLDIDHGVSGVIGDRAFAGSPELVGRLAGAWMLGAREAGMISVGKHFPGHGGVTADSHTDLPVDDRPFDDLLHNDLRPFARLIDNGLEAVMPAHVIYRACDEQPAGFSRFWLQDVLRGRLAFQGVIFSDDLSMAAAGHAGCYAERARAALQAGCDMVLVCNDPAGAAEVLEELKDYHDPVAQSRMVRLHGRPARHAERLREDPRWHRAAALAAQLSAESTLALNLGEPQ